MDWMAYLFIFSLIYSHFTPLVTATDNTARSRRVQTKRRNDVIMKGKRVEPCTAENKCGPNELIDSLLQGYVKSDPPVKDAPTEVKLGIYVNSFYSISEQTMDYQVSMYLRQSWKDPRLLYDPSVLDIYSDEVRLGDGRWDEIWVPDTFFRNEKRAEFHHVTVNNRLLKLNSTGFLWYVTKISTTLACPMKLQKYPMDTQTCPIMFESFGYTMDTMFFAWLDIPIDIDEQVELPQFTLEDTILYDCSQNYTAGAFPCLEIRFILRRDIGFFLIQVYVPSILIVILSWVSFWINVDAIPARVSLGLLTVLTMTTQSTAANQALPRVSYIKAIDVWMSMCLIFVFMALLEFAIVNVLSRRGMKKLKKFNLQQQQIARQNQNHTTRTEETPLNQINIMGRNNQDPERAQAKKRKRQVPEAKDRAKQIDKWSRKLFPMAFLTFNIVYWVLYTVPKIMGP